MRHTAPSPADPARPSLLAGEPWARLARQCGIDTRHWSAIRLGAVLAAVAWMPIAALCAQDGTLWGGATVPLLRDPVVNVRLLVGIPLLTLAQGWFVARARAVVAELRASCMVDEARLARAVSRADVASGWLGELTMLGVAFAVAALGLRVDSDAVASWRHGLAGLTWAGLYDACVGTLLCQFLIWRWWLRLVSWSSVLWAVARGELRLLAAHPDAAGGLAGLGRAQVTLAPFAAAIGAIIAAGVAHDLLYGSVQPHRVALRLSVTAVATTVALVGPLTFFVPAMIAARHRALAAYGALATDYTRAFEARWLVPGRVDDPAFLGAADIQSLADLANGFDVVRRMTIVPISRRDVAVLTAASVAPMLPLVLFVVPLDELLFHVGRTILHL